MLCPPPSRLAATEDPKGGGKEGKAGIMSEKSDRPRNKPDMLMGPGKKQIFGISLCAKNRGFYLLYVGFLASPFCTFCRLHSSRLALPSLLSFLFSFSLSHCSERRGVFFPRKYGQGERWPSLPSVPLAGGERSEGGGRRMSLSYG